MLGDFSPQCIPHVDCFKKRSTCPLAEATIRVLPVMRSSRPLIRRGCLLSCRSSFAENSCRDGTSISGRRVAGELTTRIERGGKPGVAVSDNGAEITKNAILR